MLSKIFYCFLGYGLIDFSCHLCPRGTYSKGGIDATCLLVPKGFYSSEFGATAFSNCNFSLLDGAVNCEANGGHCHKGEILSGVSGKCEKLAAGKNYLRIISN
jgi:hypothetical protein